MLTVLVGGPARWPHRDRRWAGAARVAREGKSRSRSRL